jgi:hypothetical protein
MFDEALSMARRSSGVSSTFAARRSEVFVKAMQLGCARDRNYPRLLQLVRGSKA